MEEALRASLLDGDVEIQDWGIETNVSDLSESFKARLCLARALYLESDIILIDDIFCLFDKDICSSLFLEFT